MNEIIEYIDVADLDVIFLTYDEPKKEEFWLKIKNMVPWAKRVDNVYGSDAAHKAAANLSETERFILIDGDNFPEEKFFDLTLEITEQNIHDQMRWRAKNHVNGLYYGNGGMSCWTKTFVNNMKTHENTDGREETNIEFCFDPKYIAMHDCYSTTFINHSPKQAWRAGFREGVKMCTRNGVIPDSRREFLKWVWPSNMNNLSIWHSIGRDVENGLWAMLGARMGTHYLMLREGWDHTQVRDFKYLDELWEEHKDYNDHISKDIAKDLNKYLGTNIVEFDAEQSKFFKDYISKHWYNRGPMVTEMSVIREREGW